MEACIAKKKVFIVMGVSLFTMLLGTVIGGYNNDKNKSNAESPKKSSIFIIVVGSILAIINIIVFVVSVVYAIIPIYSKGCRSLSYKYKTGEI
jgi:hypothetical protein